MPGESANGWAPLRRSAPPMGSSFPRVPKTSFAYSCATARRGNGARRARTADLLIAKRGALRHEQAPITGSDVPGCTRIWAPERGWCPKIKFRCGPVWQLPTARSDRRLSQKHLGERLHFRVTSVSIGDPVPWFPLGTLPERATAHERSGLISYAASTRQGKELRDTTSVGCRQSSLRAVRSADANAFS